MAKQIAVPPHNGVVFSLKKERSADARYKDEPQKHCAERRKADSIYMIMPRIGKCRETEADWQHQRVGAEGNGE